MNNSKSFPWLSPIHKEGNKPCFIYMIKYGCYSYLPRKFYERKYTLKTEGIQITLYFIMSSISLVKNFLWKHGMHKYYSQCETETNILWMDPIIFTIVLRALYKINAQTQMYDLSWPLTVVKLVYELQLSYFMNCRLISLFSVWTVVCSM